MASGDDLLLVPYPDGEVARSAVQHLVGAIIWPMQGGMTPPWQTQTREACRRSAGSSSSSCWPELCLLGRENARVSLILEFVHYLIYRKFFDLQKLLWQNKEHTINCFSCRKTCVLPGLWSEAKENQRDLISPGCRSGPCAQCVFEVTVQSFYCTVHLWVVSCGLTVRDAVRASWRGSWHI